MYIPTNPRIYPNCGNCAKNGDRCPDAIERCITITYCSEWEPEHPFIFNAMAWFDGQEELLRFRIINVLDKLDRWCWADLVTWAQGTIPFSEVGKVRSCIPENYPYCGKCEKFLPPEGRFENIENPEWSSEKGMWVEKKEVP